MVRISGQLLTQIIDSYGNFFNRIAKLPAEKCARDVVDEEKVHDQVGLLCSSTGISPEDLRGKKVLEVGCGFGIFTLVTRRDYGWDTTGIEPSGEGFGTSFTLARKIANEYNISEDVIINATGENLPFENETFDLVFSSTVLEHTRDPQMVLHEAIRVLKVGGVMQFVFPNYASFFEGHYAIPWIPYMKNNLGRFWVRLWGRDPAFLMTLQLLTYLQVKSWMQKLSNIEVLTYGQEIFKKRMMSIDIKNWAGLGKIKEILILVKKMRLLRIVSCLLAASGSFEPIILTAKRRNRDG